MAQSAVGSSGGQGDGDPLIFQVRESTFQDVPAFTSRPQNSNLDQFDIPLPFVIFLEATRVPYLFHWTRVLRHTARGAAFGPVGATDSSPGPESG